MAAGIGLSRSRHPDGPTPLEPLRTRRSGRQKSSRGSRDRIVGDLTAPPDGEPHRRRLLVYATVRTYSASPELAGALVGKADEVKRLIGEIDGFKAYYLVRTADGAVS